MNNEKFLQNLENVCLENVLKADCNNGSEFIVNYINNSMQNNENINNSKL